jgi:hypothetical protein
MTERRNQRRVNAFGRYSLGSTISFDQPSSLVRLATCSIPPLSSIECRYGGVLNQRNLSPCVKSIVRSFGILAVSPMVSATRTRCTTEEHVNSAKSRFKTYLCLNPSRHSFPNHTFRFQSRIHRASTYPGIRHPPVPSTSLLCSLPSATSIHRGYDFKFGVP